MLEDQIENALFTDNFFQLDDVWMTQLAQCLVSKANKVITIMVIKPLDDCTYCARSAFTQLGALVKAVRLFTASVHSQIMYPKMCSIDIYADLQAFECNLSTYYLVLSLKTT